jgi:Mce-associated membrane protein
VNAAPEPRDPSAAGQTPPVTGRPAASGGMRRPGPWRVETPAGRRAAGRRQRPTVRGPAGLARLRPSLSWLAGPPVAVLCVAVLLAMVLVGWLALRLREDSAATAARGQVLAAARVHAPVILSYDYRRLDRDFAKAQALLTGRFKEDYGRTTARVIKPVAAGNKAVVDADVAAVSAIWVRSDQAQVLLFVNQKTTTAKTRGPRVDLNRVRMTLQKADGRWLVSNVEAL